MITPKYLKQFVNPMFQPQVKSHYPNIVYPCRWERSMNSSVVRKNINSDFETMSLMKSKKKRGPRTEPCGTPFDVTCCLEVLFEITTNCCLFVK